VQRVVDVDDATCRRIDAAPETERLRRCDDRAMRDTGENPADGIKITDGQRRLLDLVGARASPFWGVSPEINPNSADIGTPLSANSPKSSARTPLACTNSAEGKGERWRLPGARVGTVDKFQGQEAPLVIYSVTTSSHADAPRGMEFLYSLNRLNVATSRAQCIWVLVASPSVFEADCRTPDQMRMANAYSRYLELAERS
jgi:AAA domain